MNAAIRCLVALMCLYFCGCSTVGTKFTETVTDENGVIATTTYKATSLAGPLGKLDTTSHKWNYRWGGEENEITTGQDSAGIDNSGQSVLVEALQAILGPLILRIPLPAASTPEPAPESSLLDSLESLSRPFVVPLE